MARYTLINSAGFIPVRTFLAGSVPPPNPGPIVMTYTIPGTYTMTVPLNRRHARVQCWGGGSGGAGPSTTDLISGAGGAGGAYAEDTISVTPGGTLTITVGGGGAGGVASNPGSVGGAGGVSHVSDNSVLAVGGSAQVDYHTAAVGGLSSACVGAIKHSGGNGYKAPSDPPGAGGAAAGTDVDGASATNTSAGVGVAGGGSGATPGVPQTPATAPGGGGAGGVELLSQSGSEGMAGEVIVSFLA